MGFVSLHETMTSRMKNNLLRVRWLSLGVLLFVFFLPLHVHFSVTPQIAKECACVQGTRNQGAPVERPVLLAPVLAAMPITVVTPVLPVHHQIRLEQVRGPPSALSV